MENKLRIKGRSSSKWRLQSSRNVSTEGYKKGQGQAIFRWRVRVDHSWDPYILDILNKPLCSIFTSTKFSDEFHMTISFFFKPVLFCPDNKGRKYGKQTNIKRLMENSRFFLLTTTWTPTLSCQFRACCTL